MSNENITMSSNGRIELTKGKWALVSAQDFDYLNKFEWAAQRNPNNLTYELWHAFTSVSLGKKKQFRIGMHRIVYCLMHNDPLFMINMTQHIDHINFDGLDNRRENIRRCTKSENQIHKRLQGNNTTGYKGVTLDKQSGKYIVRFSDGSGHRYYGGCYSCIKEAALKYNEMAIDKFGKFAILNQIKEK